MNVLRKLWFISTLLCVSYAQSEDNDKKIMCYYANWSEERNVAYRLLPKDIDVSLCTHLVYAFAMPDLASGIVPMDFLENLTEGGSEEFSDLKRKNKNLKLLLSVGGWDEGSIRFSRISSDPGKIEWFAEYSCQFIRSVGFDGLDINWQWPGLREGSNSADKANFANLLQEIKRFYLKEGLETNRDPLILSVVLPPIKEIMAKGFQMETIIREVDILNLLTMEYHTSTEPVVNHPAPLHSAPITNFNNDLTVEATVQRYLDLGIDPQKMVLGIPLYGRSFILESPVDTKIGSLAEDEGVEGFGTRTPGSLAYYEICKYVRDDGWLVERPFAAAMGPYAFRDRNWVAYDDVDMIRRKVNFAKEKGLGGIMLWTIDLDDFKGTCNISFPLSRAAREALIATDISKPTTKSPIITQITPNRSFVQLQISPERTGYLTQYNVNQRPATLTNIKPKPLINIPTISNIKPNDQLISETQTPSQLLNQNHLQQTNNGANGQSETASYPAQNSYIIGWNANNNIFKTNQSFFYKRMRIRENTNYFYSN